jgi:transposase
MRCPACRSTVGSERAEQTTQGYRRFRCGKCGKQFNERRDDRKVLNGIYWRLRTGSPWADIPERYGPPTTCANRFRCWAKIGV